MQTRRRELFTTIRTEGALLPPDLLQRVADGDRELQGLTPEAYHLAANERLGEAVTRAWNRLIGAWAGFGDALAKLPENDLATSVTRERWLIVDLLDESETVCDAQATVIRREGARVSLSYDPDEIPTAELIRRVTAAHAVRDLFVQNPPIEEIIARLYSDGGLR